MSLKVLSTTALRVFQELPSISIAASINSLNCQQLRYRKTKHWDPKWKFLRKQKVVKFKLPNYNEKTEDLDPAEVKNRLKEQGLLPPRPWMDRPVHISCTGGIFEAYVPPEGDGKVSPITAQGAKQNIEFLEKKTRTMMAIRKIKQFEEDFDTTKFCKTAEDIYIKAHEALVTRDLSGIQDFVTERAYPEITHNIRKTTVHWKFIKNIELPRIVHARCTDVITKTNIFAQVTIRFNTQQVLAIYDRFGRLMHGSEIITKDVLEYVVFEKHLANEYGQWRIHDKIMPDWMPPKQPSLATYKAIPKVPTVSENKKIAATVEKKDDSVITNTKAINE